LILGLLQLTCLRILPLSLMLLVLTKKSSWISLEEGVHLPSYGLCKSLHLSWLHLTMLSRTILKLLLVRLASEELSTAQTGVSAHELLLKEWVRSLLEHLLEEILFLLFGIHGVCKLCEFFVKNIYC
jgi:hypothetical protein